jgi:hypothetical protein
VPIEYRIEHSRRLVLARATGNLSDADVFGYQREVWSRPDVAGYDELVDMREVGEVGNPSADRLRDLAAVSATVDPTESPCKLAIVAPQDIAFGLGRMYKAYRGLDRRSTKEVGVFRTLPEALAFLGVKDMPDLWSDGLTKRST